MKTTVSKIDIPQEKIKQFMGSCKTNAFNKTSTLIYSGQRPLSAIYVHSGEVIILKRNNILEIIGAGKLILQDEFLQKKILKVELVVAASSLISWINLDTLKLLTDFNNVKV